MAKEIRRSVKFNGGDYEFDYNVDDLTFAEMAEMERITEQPVFGVTGNVTALQSSAFQWFAIRKRNPKATFADVLKGVRNRDITTTVVDVPDTEEDIVASSNADAVSAEGKATSPAPAG